MFQYSFPSVVMAVLTSNLLIIIISVCFQNQKVLHSIGYKLLSVFLVLTIIRYVVPIEMPHTQTLLLPKYASMLLQYFQHPIWKIGSLRISAWTFLQIVWAVGSICKLRNLLLSYRVFNRQIRRYGKDVTSKQPYNLLLNRICDNHKVRCRIILVSGINTPLQHGYFRPSILIPAGMELSEEELYCALCHELSHFYHHDAWIKLAMNLLSALYWWNPLSRTLQHKVDILLELHVDEKIIHKLGIDRNKYIATLLHIADSALRASHNTEKVMPVLSPMVSGGLADLGTRTEMMYKKQKASVPLMLSLLGIIICIYISSYCLIFDAHYIPQAHALDVLEFSRDNMYAVELEDGTYDIYCNNFFLENTDTLEFHNNIPVVTEK